jgi:hypothetical protein
MYCSGKLSSEKSNNILADFWLINRWRRSSNLSWNQPHNSKLFPLSCVYCGYFVVQYFLSLVQRQNLNFSTGKFHSWAKNANCVLNPSPPFPPGPQHEKYMYVGYPVAQCFTQGVLYIFCHGVQPNFPCIFGTLYSRNYRFCNSCPCRPDLLQLTLSLPLWDHLGLNKELQDFIS